MKTIKNSLFLILVVAAIQVQAQNMQWQWAMNGGGSEGESAGVILADDEGNTYVTGGYRSPGITLGDLTLTKNNITSAFTSYIIKFNSRSEVLWHINEDKVQYLHMATDKDWNVYVSGNFMNSISFGAETFYSPANNLHGFFLVKYDPSGNLVWASQTVGLTEISIDKHGNVFGVALFSGDSVSVSGTTLYRRPDVFRDYYLAKYNAAGDFEWIKNYGGMYDIYSEIHLAVSAGDNVYVAGAFHADTSYDIANDTVFFSTTDTVGTDFFIAKYDDAGSLLQFETGGAEGIKGDHIEAIATVANGDVYVSGSFAGARLRFRHTGLVGYAPCANYFLFRLDSALNIIWEQGGGNNYNNTGNYISVDDQGNVYVGGSFANTFRLDDNHLFFSKGATDFFVTKYDASGNLQYATDAGGEIFDVLYGLSADAQGNVYVSGLVGSDTFMLGDFAITNHPGNYYDIFIAKLSVSMETATNDPVAEAMLLVYPNPVESRLNIQNNKNDYSEFSLYSMTGQRILSLQLTGGTNSVDLSAFPDNVYFYKITSPTGNTVADKVVKL